MNQYYELLRESGTAMIADVCDALGAEPLVLDTRVKPTRPSSCFAGPAYTITGRNERFTGADRAKLAAIDKMPTGVVAMWAGVDAEGVCCFGDLLASAMQVRGCVAAIVDGGVRDVRYLSELQMIVYSRYTTPAQGVGRWRVTASQTTVRMRGALQPWIDVAPGDAVVGDQDGVIVIPAALSEAIAVRLSEAATSENAARQEILDGLPLLEALARHGHL